MPTLKDKLFSLGIGIIDFFRGEKTLEEGTDTSGRETGESNKIEKDKKVDPVKKDSLYLVIEKVQSCLVIVCIM